MTNLYEFGHLCALSARDAHDTPEWGNLSELLRTSGMMEQAYEVIRQGEEDDELPSEFTGLTARGAVEFCRGWFDELAKLGL
jgi:hypothetical protein